MQSLRTDVSISDFEQIKMTKLDLSGMLLTKNDISQEQEILLLALSMIAYSGIVRNEYDVDDTGERRISVQLEGPLDLLSFVNSVFRTVEKTLQSKLLEFEPPLMPEQRTNFSLGVAAAVLTQALEVDGQRNKLNAFERAVEKAFSEPPMLTNDPTAPMFVTPQQISSVLDDAKKSDPMFYGLGLKFGDSLNVYQMFVGRAKELNLFQKRRSKAEE